MYKNLLKRIIDLFISIFIFIIISPVILLIVICLKIKNKNSIFISNPVVGKNRKIFNTFFFNFRDKKINNLNEKDLKLLASYKTNYILLLINIIKGDMSFVGPMPLKPNQINSINKNMKLRFNVLPGLTGLAQLEFGKSYDYIESIIKYDIIYVETLNLLLDIKIIFRTFFLIISKFYNTIKQKYLFLILKTKKNLYIENKVIIRNKPLICIRRGSKIILKNNVTLNSKNKYHHVNMYARVKLLTDRPNAEIIIGENTRINGSCIHSRKRIKIGRNCLIAANCQIIDCNGHDICPDDPSLRIHTTGDAKSIIIGDNVWIGTGCIILPGVTIGNGSIIGAGSVVTKSIPENTLAAGNPAKIIKKLK